MTNLITVRILSLSCVVVVVVVVAVVAVVVVVVVVVVVYLSYSILWGRGGWPRGSNEPVLICNLDIHLYMLANFMRIRMLATILLFLIYTLHL